MYYSDGSCKDTSNPLRPAEDLVLNMRNSDILCTKVSYKIRFGLKVCSQRETPRNEEFKNVMTNSTMIFLAKKPKRM